MDLMMQQQLIARLHQTHAMATTTGVELIQQSLLWQQSNQHIGFWPELEKAMSQVKRSPCNGIGLDGLAMGCCHPLLTIDFKADGD